MKVDEFLYTGLSLVVFFCTLVHSQHDRRYVAEDSGTHEGWQGRKQENGDYTRVETAMKTTVTIGGCAHLYRPLFNSPFL